MILETENQCRKLRRESTIMRAYADPILPAPIIPTVCPFKRLPTNLHTTFMLHECSTLLGLLSSSGTCSANPDEYSSKNGEN
jgi:hypothetical protein